MRFSRINDIASAIRIATRTTATLMCRPEITLCNQHECGCIESGLSPLLRARGPLNLAPIDFLAKPFQLDELLRKVISTPVHRLASSRLRPGK